MEKSKQGWDENHWEYHCGGCAEPHPSFWKTITESDEFKDWYKEQMKRIRECKCFENNGKICDCVIFDIDESMECNAFSSNHWKAFVGFLKKK